MWIDLPQLLLRLYRANSYSWFHFHHQISATERSYPPTSLYHHECLHVLVSAFLQQPNQILTTPIRVDFPHDQVKQSMCVAHVLTWHIQGLHVVLDLIDEWFQLVHIVDFMHWCHFIQEIVRSSISSSKATFELRDCSRVAFSIISHTILDALQVLVIS